MNEMSMKAVEPAALHAEIARLQKMVRVLMDRAERSTATQTTDFNLFQTTIMLEEQVRKRTGELETALRDNEKMTRALRDGEEKLRSLIEAIPDLIIVKDGDGRWQESNRAARQTFELADTGWRGLHDRVLATMTRPCYRDALMQCEQSDEKAWRAHGLTRVQESIPRPDGSRPLFDVIKKPLFSEDGARRALIVVGRDVTEMRQAEEALRVIASVFDNSQEAILITDAWNRIIDVNPAFSRITGYSRDEVLGKSPNLLASGLQDRTFYKKMWQSLERDKWWRGEIWNRRKNGELYAELLSISMICDNEGRVLRHVAVFSDISYIKAHEAELNRVANYDALTGIPNRRLLSDRLQQGILNAQRNQSVLAVCYLDLDGFKQVNDGYGHDAGDRLLMAVTHRLQQSLRAGDTLARLGGDEFVVLFNGLKGEQECVPVLERILKNVAEPISIGGHEAVVSASIGVTFYPGDDEDGDTLMRHADQAMYLAKQRGKNCFHLYDPAHDLRARSLHQTRRRILSGLENGEFELYYQPVVDLASNGCIGAEALIRWCHPERGLLLPGEFLPYVEDSELEIRLGDWVITRALEQLAQWRHLGGPVRVAVNISARHLLSGDFLAGLEQKLSLHPQLPAGCLEIEVLETAALEDIARSADIIDACRRLGVSFALDDFGTGYSSLSYLRRLEAETIKIDQSFVRGMLEDEGDRAIVRGIVALARSFGRRTVAEGIETEAHYHAVREAGCDSGQGFGIARPMPLAQLAEWRIR